MRAAFLLCAAALSLAAQPHPKVDYVTYLGGSYAEWVAGVAVDASGSAYVAGTTSSPDFPLTSTALGTPGKDHPCAFVTKFNPNGTAIVFSSCIADSVAVAFGMDAAGNLYLALQGSVVKLDPAGSKILYTRTIQSGLEAMAVDLAGNVYLAGVAGTELNTTPGAYQTQLAPGNCPDKYGDPNPCKDAFAMKLSPSGAVVFATYLGGSQPDSAHAIAVDSAGNVWIAGETLSPNFPTTANALQSSFHGEQDLGPLRFGDAFIAKLDSSGGKLLYSSYLGGSAPDSARALAVDASGSAYVAGGTQSADFPTTPGVLQPAYAGASNPMPSLSGDGFVAKFSPAGALVYSTYLGTTASEAITAMAIDQNGQVYVNVNPTHDPALACGHTTQPISILNAGGTALAGASTVGGASLAIDNRGGVYTAGSTYTLAQFATSRAYQTRYGGGDSDASAAKVDFSQPAGLYVACIVNAATLSSPGGAVAPGEIVVLFGTGFGSNPSLDFDGYPAPVQYANDTRINAVVPFELPPLATFLTVRSGAETSGPEKIPVAVADPGLYTAILNQDGTVNSASNPAPRGSMVSVYLTGAGLMNPPLTDDAVGSFSPPFAVPALGVSAYIDYLPSLVLYAGQAPGLITGAVQVNVQVPDTAHAFAAVPVTVSVGSYRTPPVTLAIR